MSVENFQAYQGIAPRFEKPVVHIEHKQRSHHEFTSRLRKKATSRGRPTITTTVIAVVHRRGQVMLGEKVVRALPITRDRHVCVCMCARAPLECGECAASLQASEQAGKKEAPTKHQTSAHIRAHTQQGAAGRTCALCACQVVAIALLGVLLLLLLVLV